MAIQRPASNRDARETALYVEQMTRELRNLAASSGLEFLAYLLGMAEDEAGAVASRLGGKRSPGATGT